MRVVVTVSVLALLIAAGVYSALPPGSQTLPGEVDGVRGAIHVHTNRSDGSGTLQQVAAAAARAGLQFVVLTDHGDATRLDDGTRLPQSPRYVGNVLVVDAVEISADDGHVVVLGLPEVPYPLGGDVRDIVEDASRFGATTIAAHPGSQKPELRWTEWTATFSGLEWLNGDSESRAESWPALARVLFAYPWRQAESLSTLLDRPDDILRRWDALTARRRVVALAGADAHARLAASNVGWGRLLELRLPSYEAMFRTFSVTVQGVRFGRNAAPDAVALLDGIARGHVYSSVDGAATPAAVSFRAVRNGETWSAGDFVPPDGGDVELVVDANGPTGSRIVLLKDGDALAEAGGSTLKRVVPGERAVYRAEIRIPNAPGAPAVPWVVTNPIYLRAADDHVAPSAPATAFAPQDESAERWHVETNPTSKAAVDTVRAISGMETLLRWAIGGRRSDSPFAAAVMTAGRGMENYRQLTFTARAEQPMRLSVQLRTDTGERWRRSVYVDDTRREVVVLFDDVRPVGKTAQRRVPLASVRDVLFVVDTVNTALGAAGKVWIDDVKYGR